MKKNNLATKNDIKRLEVDIKRLEVDIKRLEQKLDVRFDEYEHKMNDRFDEVIKEIRESREDRILLGHRVVEHDETIEDHELRIAGLEKHQQIHE